MPVDPEVRMLLDRLASMNLPELSTLSPGEARALSRDRRALLPPGPEADVEDIVVNGPAGELAVRLFRPKTEPGRAKKPLPVLVWFHGGGFVIGSVHESDADCRMLATLANIAVASVEYRLAPEHPFPAAPEDCFAALQQIIARAGELGIDGTRVAVGGDSAGAALAASVCLMAQDRGGPPIRFQALVYPVTDSVSLETPSHHHNAEGFYLTRKSVIWFRDQYLPRPADRENPYASPLRRKDLRGLPPALIVTAEFDPLRDEGQAYAARLLDADVPVVLSNYAGMIHGFFSLSAFLTAGRRVHDEIAAALRDALQA